MAKYEAWWTTPRDGAASFSSPLWGSSSASSSNSSSAASSQTSASSLDLAVCSPRTLQVRYQELTAQLEHCQTWERQIQGEREKIVSELLLECKSARSKAMPIAPPPTAPPPTAPAYLPAPMLRTSAPAPARSAAAPSVAASEIEPPSRQQLLTRLIDGKREDYRRIFVPGRGWVSKSKLQSELRVSELELEHLAKKSQGSLKI